ncbi:hypothetical protein VTL71DRAFT_6572 [Oculimacula yallundae]|uniref:BZIP domain-containing protein n=1 Tax=Oculimacula yallundae TaxID=86028 RepID=A0ABR4BXC8_9HELO
MHARSQHLQPASTCPVHLYLALIPCQRSLSFFLSFSSTSFQQSITRQHLCINCRRLLQLTLTNPQRAGLGPSQLNFTMVGATANTNKSSHSYYLGTAQRSSNHNNVSSHSRYLGTAQRSNSNLLCQNHHSQQQQQQQQQQQHLPQNQISFDSCQAQQFVWPELEPSEFFSPSSVLSPPTDLSFSQDCLPDSGQYQELGFSPFVSESADSLGNSIPILDPVGDFWGHQSGENDTMALAQYHLPSRGDSMIDRSPYIGSHNSFTPTSSTTSEMPSTTAFSNSHHPSVSSSMDNCSPEMYSLSGPYPDMSVSNFSDNSSNNYPSDLFPEQLSRAPSDPSPVLSNARSTRSTPESNNSRKVSRSPNTTSGQTPISKVQKRTLNTLAARRYRQKRVDQVQSLENSLKETQDERDALKLKVARLEAEVEILRGLLSFRFFVRLWSGKWYGGFRRCRLCRYMDHAILCSQKNVQIGKICLIIALGRLKIF